MKKKLLLGTVLAAASWLANAASSLDTLDAFMKTAKSGRATFTQVVTAPSRDGQPPRAKTSSGTFEFQRPNKFRFDYQKPFEQVIVADGQTLWLHDVDLNQVTSRNQNLVLGSTPAAVIASSPNLTALSRTFNLEAAPEKDGLQWAVATPKDREGQLNSIRIGLRGTELARLEIVDGFGQRSVITFDKMEVNPAIPAERFQFKPPAGASVVKQ